MDNIFQVDLYIIIIEVVNIVIIDAMQQFIMFLFWLRLINT